jgi:hypothetical protein
MVPLAIWLGHFFFCDFDAGIFPNVIFHELLTQSALDIHKPEWYLLCFTLALRFFAIRPKTSDMNFRGLFLNAKLPFPHLSLIERPTASLQ